MDMPILFSAAREFRVDAKRIREWCKNKDLLKKLSEKRGQSKRKRLSGAGRKPLDEDMKKVLLDWIIDMRLNNLRVSRRMIKAKAKDLSTVNCFKASSGWLRRFMWRHGLSLRRKTTVCQAPPADSIPKLVSYIIHLRSQQIKHKYSPANIFASDAGLICRPTQLWNQLVLDVFPLKQLVMRKTTRRLFSPPEQMEQS